METKKYNPPGLALDLCLFTIVDKQEENPKKIPEKELKFLALKRLKEPYKGMYTLAGCAAVEGEKTAETLKKKLKEKSGINTDEIYMEIGGVFDDPKRDKFGYYARNCGCAKRFGGGISRKRACFSQQSF